jgi:hypothetical protein
MRVRTLAAAVAIAGAGFAGIVGTSSANAVSHPTLSTTSRTEVLISAKCYAEVQVTHTYFHYSTKDGRYVAYAGSGRTTTTTSTTCHK